MRAWSPVGSLVSLFLIATLAGCLGGDEPAPVVQSGPLSVGTVLATLSAPLGDVTVVHEALDLATSLGQLRADVYRADPATLPADWKSPIILIASPYNNPSKDPNDDDRIHSDLYDWLEEYLVPRGYAIVHLDTLGTRESTGCTTVMDSTERQATAEAIDMLGEMEWSSGRVGMIGKSYVGATQVGAAVQGPEHLVTIVPVSPVTNAYAYHYRNGVPYLGNQLTNVLYATNSNVDYDLERTEPPSDLPDGAACFPESIARGALPTGDYTDAWADRDIRGQVPDQRKDISVLFIHGHQDWNVKPDHFTDVWNSYPSDVKLAVVGQWHHDYPDNNRWEPDTHGSREDWYYLLHRWFDHFLMGIDTGLVQEIAACPVQTQGSDALWRCLGAFPPAASDHAALAGQDLVLHLTQDGLATEPGSGIATYTEVVGDAARLAGQGEGTPIRLQYGYTFEERTRVVGIPNITLAVSTTSPYNAHLITALGVESQDGADEITWAIQSLRHRDGLTGQPILPGILYEVTFDFFMVDHVFEAGEKLTLELRGFSLEPNLGVVPNPVPGHITVEQGSSSVWLPVLGDGRAFTPLPKDAFPAEYNPQLEDQ